MPAVKPTTTKRSAPNQARSQKTMARILDTAATLLEEVGFEGLSTNLICKRAGLTPPALYRYFPNKYAVLKELGEQLMAKQNAVLETWTIDLTDPDDLPAALEVLLVETVRVTREMPAGAWIMRSLHASPILSDVRLQSHRTVSRALCKRLFAIHPNLDRAEAEHAMRLGVELGYATVEMIFDERALDEDRIVRTTAALLAHNIARVIWP